MKLDLEGIEARAKAAGTGRDWSWTKGATEGYVPQTAMLGETLICMSDTYEGHNEDAAHIAGLSPDVALALVATLRKQDEALTAIHELLKGRLIADGPDASRRVTEVLRKIAEARR